MGENMHDKVDQLNEHSHQVDVHPDKGYASIQHKGSDLCMDVHCECGHHGHIDEAFCLYYQCQACQRVFIVGAVLMLASVPEDLVLYVLGELDGLVKRDDRDPRFHGNDDLDCARRGLGTQRFAVVSEGDAKFYSLVLAVAADHYKKQHKRFKALAAAAREQDDEARAQEWIDSAAEAETMRRKSKAELDRLLGDMALAKEEPHGQ